MRFPQRIFPEKIPLPFKAKKTILALGPQTKNRLCLLEANSAWLSRPHPDLSNPDDARQFEQDVKSALKARPQIIACDLHPDYSSSRYAQEVLAARGYALTRIQHHHAHIASAMAENSLLNQQVIGIAFDGTGLGADNQLWGAEFLLCDYRNYKRAAHLQEVALLAGEQAIRQPWRLTCAWLYLTYQDRFLRLENNFIKKVDRKQWSVLKKMYLGNFNAPKAASMGRLFDAVAALVLAKKTAAFEAELAMELEQVAAGCRLPALQAGRQVFPTDRQATGYQFKITKSREGYILDPRPIFRGILLDLKRGRAKEKIAYRFHLTIAEMMWATCFLLRKENNLNKVVLSGGVFQNKLLFRLSTSLLAKEGFNVYWHRQLAASDSSLSLGQAAIACFR